MYFSYIINTDIHINTIIKYTYQNGGDIVFYRNFLEKVNINQYKKKKNVYVIFTNINTVKIIMSNFLNRVKIVKYDISKLRYLNRSKNINFNIYNMKIENENFKIVENNNLSIFQKINIERVIISTLSKICTQFIPITLYHTITDGFVNINIVFDNNIKLKYKYLIYLILKNMIISFHDDDEDNEEYLNTLVII